MPTYSTDKSVIWLHWLFHRVYAKEHSSCNNMPGSTPTEYSLQGRKVPTCACWVRIYPILWLLRLHEGSNAYLLFDN